MRASAARPRNSTPSPWSTVKGTCKGQRNPQPIIQPLPCFSLQPCSIAAPEEKGDDAVESGQDTGHLRSRKAASPFPRAEGSKNTQTDKHRSPPPAEAQEEGARALVDPLKI